MKPGMVVVTVCCVLWVTGCASEKGPDTAPALAAAEAWLTLVDSGDYGMSWDQATAHFRTVVTREQWVRLLESQRAPLGVPQGRHLQSATFETSLRGAPTGSYVVAQFEVQFEGQAPSAEMVTTALEEGQWRVHAYYPK